MQRILSTSVVMLLVRRPTAHDFSEDAISVDAEEPLSFPFLSSVN